MTRSVQEALQDVEDLLGSSGWPDRAVWFRQRSDALSKLAPGSDAHTDVLREIHSVLVGQGSLSDLPLYPTDASGLTRATARERLWDLVDEVGRLTETRLIDEG
jgi:hypothetical protein